MGQKAEKTTMDRTKQKVAGKIIGTIFVVVTGLELVALPFLCYEFIYKEQLLREQLEHFRGDPQPGPLAASLPRAIQHMHDWALACLLYTAFTLVKMFLSVVLLIGQKVDSPWLVLAWVVGYPLMHAATSVVLLWFAVPWYFDVDLVVALALLQLVVISSVLVTRSVFVLYRSVRQQRRTLAPADPPAC